MKTIRMHQSVVTVLKNCSCCLAENNLEDDFNEQKIKEEIERYHVELNSAMKLLLLGTGEAGKSTFFKQMHIHYGQGFSEEDRQRYKQVIYQNIFTAMQSMLNAMDLLGIPFEKSDHAILANSLLEIDVGTVTTLETSAMTAIKCLWSDTSVQKCYDRRREYQLIDSAKYFFNKLDCLAHTNYIPDDNDILRSRIVTTGIVEHIFDTQKSDARRYGGKRSLLRVIDVGGQRSERLKWLQCFDDVTSVIFLVALSEYDQTLSEAQGLNRLKESLGLFKVILSTPYLKNSSTILFLNKEDILEEKIMTSHLVDYFPDFNGPKRNAVAAKSFIGKMFEASLEDKHKQLYMHYTCATEKAHVVLFPPDSFIGSSKSNYIKLDSDINQRISILFKYEKNVRNILLAERNGTCTFFLMYILCLQRIENRVEIQEIFEEYLYQCRTQ